MTKQLSDFVEGLRRCGLLRAEQVEDVARRAAATGADPQVIARDIVARGWLTAFQVKMLWKGRGSELFLGQYVLFDRLGEGGMGEVFKARHRRMERDVALKVIRKEKLGSPEAVRRFQREIEAAAKLFHENVVLAYDADQAGDRHFFAMEYVEGANLARLVKDKGPLPVAQACDCVRQAALGLQHAFERGMVHRDIKPSNLLLGKGGVVKVLDLGLARLETSGPELESRITQEGLVIGTPDFLSPEQARNARTADIRADIYALGCTFYFLLAGKPPYPGGTPTEKMLRHTTDPLPVIERPDVPPALEAIVHKMLAKKPADRYQTPAEVALALRPFAGPLPAGSNIALSRPAATIDPLASAKHAALSPLPEEEEEEPRTESQFRLPPPRPPKQPPRERTRWNPLIALAAGLVALGIAAGVVYVLFKKNAPTDKQGLEKEFRNPYEMAFALISAGSFEMGSPDGEIGRGDDEGPVHAVEITRPFYMGTTEVTLRQFKAVTGRLPKDYKGAADDLDVPATMVTQGEAQNFCRRLTSEQGEGGRKGWEYRLPTEAEWEYACRAGTKTPYSTGRLLAHTEALFGEKDAKGPGKVAQFAPNPWGLYDMHGNAAEWVADQYDKFYYENSPAKDPQGPDKRAKYVFRGGGFNDPAEACRSARRGGDYPEKVQPNLGFRIVYAQAGK
jgi:formylglycine-generating enzyme required for sulfatase activity/tRNA A-37 threonylcarbamoyl transferase component Bud32